MYWGIDRSVNRLFVRIDGTTTPEERIENWRKILESWKPGGTGVISFAGTVIPLSLVEVDKFAKAAASKGIKKVAWLGQDPATEEYVRAVIKVFDYNGVVSKWFQFGQEMFDWLNEEV
ncbi:MAG: hypothetical protein GWN00_21635 [Aliifodinibius sp.]|nr:hypothetical protein [Fodinibius sp.]NIV13552.1 hypothetical protein [Fodinibius sp.]NIY27309.1 hypothetical protein [Fodinibius sp.]